MEQLNAASGEIVEILIADGVTRPVIESILKQARAFGITINFVSPTRISEIAESHQHQGVLALIKSHRYASFESYLKALTTTQDHIRVLVLDEINDPRNFGALLRTADATGIKDVIIPKDRSAAVTPIVIKASAGAALHMDIYRVVNLRRAIQSLKRLGFWFVGLTSAAQETIYGRTYSGRLGIVLGSEGHGLRPVIQGECDFQVAIPMLGKVDSLNVSVAGAVLMYEIVRQDIAAKAVKTAVADGKSRKSK